MRSGMSKGQGTNPGTIGPPPIKKNGFKDEDFEISGWCKNRPNCVAVARNKHGVAVRDTKDASKATLQFTNDEWNAFIKGAKDGQFDPKL